MSSPDPEEQRHRRIQTRTNVIGAVIAGCLLFATICLGIWQTFNSTQALHDAENSTQLDERAWISVTEPPRLGVKVGTPIVAVLTLKNTGKTPALNMETQVFMTTLSGNTSDSDAERQVNIRRVQEPFVPDGDLPPEGLKLTKAHNLEALTDEQRAAVHSGALLLYLSEVNQYVDIFGKPHTTKSCFKVISGPNDLPEDRGLFEYASFGNDMN